MSGRRNFDTDGLRDSTNKELTCKRRLTVLLTLNRIVSHSDETDSRVGFTGVARNVQ